MALFSFDAACFAQWNNKGDLSQIIQDPRKCLIELIEERVDDAATSAGYFAIFAQVICSGNETSGDGSSLKIECLLSHHPGLKNYFHESPMPCDGIAHVFNSNRNKHDFANELCHLDPVAFMNFIPLFNNIENISKS